MKRISTDYYLLVLSLLPLIIAFALLILLNLANEKVFHRMESLVADLNAAHQTLSSTQSYKQIEPSVREKTEGLLMNFESTLWTFDNLFSGTYRISIAWVAITLICLVGQWIVFKRTLR